MRKSLSQKLADNLDYFVSNPKRRCVTERGCRYHGETLGIKTKGCFIGALLPVATRKLLDIHFKDKSVSSVIKYSDFYNIKLPKIITDNESLMYDFQLLHDDGKSYWNKNSLNEHGMNKLIKIVNKYDLDREPFDKFLN